MNTADPPRYSKAWLSAREQADAAARAPELLDPLGRRLAGISPLVVCDLGSGTGAMGRWLAGRLAGPQHWIMWDHDPELLAHAAASMADTAADGAPVTVETRQRDIAAVTTDDFRGVSLVTASALLDLLTADEVDRLAAACVQAGCPALLTLSVVGRVALTPPDPLDEEIAAAFHAHQRRRTDGRSLLGPDAVDVTTEAFMRHGASVLTCPSPWRLGPEDSPLIAEWLRGWVAAACEQRPSLAGDADGYLRRRLAAAAAGELRVVVNHADLLANHE